MYMWVDMGRKEKEKGRGGRKKKPPHRVLLSDIGFATNYNAMLFLSTCKQSHGLRLAVSLLLLWLPQLQAR